MFESLQSAEPHLRPLSTPAIEHWGIAQLIEFYQMDFDEALDAAGPILANFKPIRLHELAAMSPVGRQWLRDQLREFSVLSAESRNLTMEFAGAQTQALTASFGRSDDGDEDDIVGSGSEDSEELNDAEELEDAEDSESARTRGSCTCC